MTDADPGDAPFARRPSGTRFVGRCVCGRRWTSHQVAHCAACHITFSSDSAFDRHRRGMACLDPVTAVKQSGKPVFQLRHDKFGDPVWGLPGSWNPREEQG